MVERIDAHCVEEIDRWDQMLASTHPFHLQEFQHPNAMRPG